MIPTSQNQPPCFMKDLMATKETQNNQMAGHKRKGRIGKREQEKERKERKIGNQIHTRAQITTFLKLLEISE